MLQIFVVLQSVFQPKGAKPECTRGICQERGNFYKTLFQYLSQSHSVACFGSIGLEEHMGQPHSVKLCLPASSPSTTAQFAELAKALDKFLATNEGVRTRKTYPCKSVSQMAAYHQC